MIALLGVLIFSAIGSARSEGKAAVAGADPLSTWTVTLTPNWVSPFDDASSNHQAVWVYPKSHTTPYRSPDSCRCRARYLLLDPRSTDADGRRGRDDWWFVIQRNWPTSFDPYRHGAWGRLVNFHNVAGDVGWNTGSGVSAFALDWLAAKAPQFTLEYADGGKPHYLPVPERRVWHTYVVHFIAGRTDGSTARAGAVTIWADGAKTPVVKLREINTLQRYDGVTQKWMQVWEGDYTRDLPRPTSQSFALTRIGRTLSEALADRPVATGTSASGQFYRGSGMNLGPPSSARARPLSSADTLTPAGLG
jgi:hypothetical protein